ncbi:MAG: alpha/beta hydrolase [Rhodospirillales bacterium]|nr:alpha/beta hydrolase [Rhodospirillales bacterium]
MGFDHGGRQWHDRRKTREGGEGMAAALHCEQSGTGMPTLLLLHGLGVNGAVWQGVVERLGAWPGRILVPDLRGHGASPHFRHYGMGEHAADLGELLERGERVHVVGHSLGGAIAIVLASGMFGVAVERVLAFGVKQSWRSEEIEKAEKFAATPVRWFDDRQEAAERFLRVSGLSGLVGSDVEVVSRGIVGEGGRTRLAADPRTVLSGGIAMAAMMAASRAPIRLARGGADPMVSLAELLPYDPDAFDIAGCGHNPHVEAPEVLARLILDGLERGAEPRATVELLL